MEIWNQNFTSKESAPFLSACQHLRGFCSLERLKGGNCSHSLSEFSILVLHGSNLTSARSFHQQGKFHCVAKSILCISSECTCCWIYTRRLMIFTLSPPGTAAVILERQSNISRTFYLRIMQWCGNTVNNLLKSFCQWHLKMPLGQSREDRTFY